jgi:preprotein translocase subunit SecY
MFKTFIDLFKNKEIRGKIYFTLGMLFVFKFGSTIPVPGIDATQITSAVENNSILGIMNMLGGGSLQQMSVFALGVSPYITASIIIQLLSMDVIPALTELTKSGQQGRKKMDKVTRYVTIVLAYVQAFSMVMMFDRSYGILENGNTGTYLYVATILTAGTMFLLWIGDRITAKGIGNGISFIIFAGIVARMPFTFSSVYNVLVDTSSQSAMMSGLISFGLYIIMYIVIILLVVFMQLAIRKIPIQYTSSGSMKRTNDRTYLPLKINSASVIPVIFAQAIITAPQIVVSFVNPTLYNKMQSWLSLTSPIGLLLYVVLIILFTFFYTNLQVDPQKISDNLNKSGSYIPGVRPGKETAEYLSTVLNRITVLGALFLTVIAVLPYLLAMFTNIGTSAALGGTGIIIVVGVAMETIKQLKGQLTQKAKYTGFVSR